MRDGTPVAIAISEESGRRVELHDDRVARAFRGFDGYRVHEIVPDGGDDETYWLTSSKNLYGERVLHEDRDCLSSRDPSLIREATANEIEAFRPCSVCAVDREYRGGSNETHECPLCGDKNIGQLPTHMRACDGDSEAVDRGEGVETDGGANTYLDSREEWFLIGLVENALSRREEERWEACRRLVQELLARLDRGTRAHQLVRDGCCSSHPSSSQWREALGRAKTALEVRDR